MATKTLDSEAHRIAGEVNYGIDEAQLKEECRDAARELGLLYEVVYSAVRNTYIAVYERGEE